PGEYLGLHLTVGLCVTLAALVIFIVIGRAVVGEPEVAAFDLAFAGRMQRHAQEHALLLGLFRAITQLGSFTVMTTYTVAGGLILLMRRHRVLAMVWFIAAAGGGLINAELKDGFNRQ